jgi:hypothetical protein
MRISVALIADLVANGMTMHVSQQTILAHALPSSARFRHLTDAHPRTRQAKAFGSVASDHERL